MVRAILDGTKTQTRRVVKLRNGQYMPPSEKADINGWRQMLRACPYGQPGDRLWVRETFADLRGTGIEHRPDPSGPLKRYAFAADHPPGSNGDEARKEFGVKWKPSIHMPRAASRITLEITGLRVERLQGISEADSVAEGIERITSGLAKGGWYRGPLRGDGASIVQQAGHDSKIPTAHPRLAYQALWESINGPESWDANPWVWVVEFQPIDAATSAAVSR